jgi:hypothetical protein
VVWKYGLAGEQHHFPVGKANLGAVLRRVIDSPGEILNWIVVGDLHKIGG